MAIISEELVGLSARADIAELGAGVGFASQMVANTDELTYLYIGQLDEALRAKILLFDWWTANGDRTLTEHGGNPNLLWVHRDRKPYVIDHNLAFDESALKDFWSHHIFADSRVQWDNAFRALMESLMETALHDLESWWLAMPPEWTEIQTGVTLESVRKLLWRFQAAPVKFWGAV